MLSALESRHRKNSLQHGVELDRVLLDAVQHLVAFAGVGARASQRQPDAGNGERSSCDTPLSRLRSLWISLRNSPAMESKSRTRSAISSGDCLGLRLRECRDCRAPARCVACAGARWAYSGSARSAGTETRRQSCPELQRPEKSPGTRSEAAAGQTPRLSNILRLRGAGSAGLTTIDVVRVRRGPAVCSGLRRMRLKMLSGHRPAA